MLGKPGSRRRSGPIFKVTSCDCKDCVAACLNSPGWFMPGGVKALANHMNLDIPTLFQKYLAVGVTAMPDGSQRHGVMPHKMRDGKKPGGVWTLGELAQPGRCIFFDRGRCTVHPVRPYECARMIHDRKKDSIKLRHLIIKSWTPEALKPYAELTGKHLFGAPPRERR